jgi:hypothetical protein
MIERGQLGRGGRLRIQDGGDQPVDRLGPGNPLEGVLDDAHRHGPGARVGGVDLHFAQEGAVGQPPAARELLVGAHPPQQVGPGRRGIAPEPTRPRSARHSMPGSSRSSSARASSPSPVASGPPARPKTTRVPVSIRVNRRICGQAPAPPAERGLDLRLVGQIDRRAVPGGARGTTPRGSARRRSAGRPVRTTAAAVPGRAAGGPS